MSFAIVCDSHHTPDTCLGLVDRNKTRAIWWTPHEAHLLLEIRTKVGAEKILRGLRHNNPRIVDFSEACDTLAKQQDMLAL